MIANRTHPMCDRDTQRRKGLGYAGSCEPPGTDSAGWCLGGPESNRVASDPVLEQGKTMAIGR